MVGDMVMPAAILDALDRLSTGDSRAEVLFERHRAAVTRRRSLPAGRAAGYRRRRWSPHSGQGRAARITRADVAPLASRLQAAGLSAAAFPDYVERTHQENLRRVREGDLDHLVFYLLQSTRFTTLAAHRARGQCPHASSSPSTRRSATSS